MKTEMAPKKSSSMLEGFAAKAEVDESAGAGPLAGSAFLKAIKANDGAGAFEAFKAMVGAYESETEPVDAEILEE